MTDLKNENWLPARQAWKEFCELNPGLGLAGSANSFVWFNRIHGKAMIEAGVMRRALSRKLLIDKSRFGQVAFQYLTEGGDAAAQQKARVGK